MAQRRNRRATKGLAIPIHRPRPRITRTGRRTVARFTTPPHALEPRCARASLRSNEAPKKFRLASLGSKSACAHRSYLAAQASALAEHGLPNTTDTTKPQPLGLPGPEPGQADAPRGKALVRTARSSLHKQGRLAQHGLPNTTDSAQTHRLPPHSTASSRTVSRPTHHRPAAPAAGRGRGWRWLLLRRRVTTKLPAKKLE